MTWRKQDRSIGSFEGKVLFQECTHLVARNKVQLSYAVRVPFELLRKLQLAEYSREMTHPWMPSQGRYICLHNMRCRIAVRVHAFGPNIPWKNCRSEACRLWSRVVLFSYM